MADRAFVVTDLGYGDTGKGTTVDYLCSLRPSNLVVRHNGAGQAGHNVVTSDGRQHVFSQFGSGSFHLGTHTLLSSKMLVEPSTMLREAEDLIKLGLVDIWERISVDENCMIITPWHKSANHLREIARGDGRHGSCGYGVGETMSDSITVPELTLRVIDLVDQRKLLSKLRAIREYKYQQLRSDYSDLDNQLAEQAWNTFTDDDLIHDLASVYELWRCLVEITNTDDIAASLKKYDQLVFEGAQGVLLDEWYGFHPHTTWSTTTHSNALELLKDYGYNHEICRLGVIRAYMTRHGAGPFVTEEIGMADQLPDSHNGSEVWQGNFRVGHLDIVAHRYAKEVCGGVDGIVVTGVDRLLGRQTWKWAESYCYSGYDHSLRKEFEFDDKGCIKRIIPGGIDQLDRQERITNALKLCLPKYVSLGADYSNDDRLNMIVNRIEEQLEAPVVITSFGPMVEDKKSSL